MDLDVNNNDSVARPADMMKIIIILLLLAITLSAALAAGSTCRGITLSGAGAFGAFEAGVIWGLLDKRATSDVEWQFATGVSAGSLNAAIMSMFSVGDESAASQYLNNLWLGITQEQVFVEWPGGVVDGLLLQKGIFNDAPLNKYLHAHVNQTMINQSTRGLQFGATNIDTGNFDLFNKSASDIALALQASCSIPGIWPPTVIDDVVYQDGGVTYMTPVTDTARLCYDTGATEVILDVIMIGYMEDDVNMADAKTIDLLMRTLHIIKTNWYYKDIFTTFQAFPDVVINVYYPTGPFPGNVLSFSYSAPLLKIGYDTAMNESTTFGLTKNNFESALNKAFPFGLNL
ncbi:hypothetical protein SAMD00019534_096910 [Acytostelium subglobosum LB1]|uniref:hypothetical protein n=1 Tax=Acytostelium subglobosum LB1 TaxID=1410327 RepID=UPI000644F81A|nr:hypothetical protein SAMD00019534_096910 [Acytostelium subglobosum LB1]GAM26516.1 hypothetical protein SAMD00019534_096910 [Acytostelium subglobosum LB1]|eukprot:XP_012750612.1 hypothetical protein SAMD00019534_096910 [Acytostelium subglobosum LB1]